VGVYLRDISRFELEEGQFEADLDAWMKWEGAAEPPPLRFSNGDLAMQEIVARETEGEWHSVRWHLQGTFRGKFDLHDFPYDAQPLEIAVELPTMGTHGGTDRTFTLYPDAAASGMSDDFSITGWIYDRAFTVREYETRLASDLGSVRDEGQPRTGQAVAYRILMKRPFASYIIKFLLPLTIIVLVSMSVFWVDEDRLDVRSSVGVTGVLSCIAFHFTQADTLPDVGYLVRADRLFLLAYTVVALALGVTFVVHRLALNNVGSAKRIDAAARVCAPLGFVVAAWVILSPPEAEPAAVEESVVAAPAEARTSHDDVIVIARSSNSLDHEEDITYRMVGGGADDAHRTGASEHAHLLERMPRVTNDLVRFLPDGGMVVTWRLRPGLLWSDGHPIDSGDLNFTLGTLPDAERAERHVVDARTVRVHWPDRAAAHLTDFRLLPEHAVADAAGEGVEALRKRIDSGATPGDGPFVFVRLRDDGMRIYARNANYHGRRARVSELHICNDYNAPCADPKRATYWPVVSGERMRVTQAANAGVRPLTVAPGSRSFFQFLMMADLPEFVTIEARRALLGAIRRAEIRDIDPYASVADTYRGAGVTNHVEPYNPEASRPILGTFTAQRPLPLTCVIASLGTKGPCEIVEQSLRDAGAVVRVTRVPLADYRRMAEEGGFSGLLLAQVGADDETMMARAWGVVLVGRRYLDYTRSLGFGWGPEQQKLSRTVTSSLYRERRQAALDTLARQYAEVLPTVPLSAHAPKRLWDARLRGVTTRYRNIEDWYTISPDQLAVEAAAASAPPGTF